MKISIILFGLLLSNIFTPLPSDNGVLRIKVEGVKKTSGNLGVMLFDQEDGFPDQKNRAYSWKEVKVINRQPVIEFSDLPPGRYAIALVHDVNGNQDLDKNIMGIPTEPFGFSNNKSILFGLPKFHEAAVEVRKGGSVESTIKLIDLF